jgi:hypothetical protein
MARRPTTPLLVAILAAGGLGPSECGAPEPSDEPAGATAPLRHDFPAVSVPAGSEQDGLCLSWTVGNEVPLYVETVELLAGPGWHHSNWLIVDETDFPGPDGAWNCDDRQFDELTAALRGGVLTAQSTQSTHDVQAFPPGHVLVLPRRARIVGTSHTLNVGDADLSTRISLVLKTIDKTQVKKKLRGLSIQNRSIVLQPQAQSRQTTRCDLAGPHLAGVGRPLDFRLFFVVPHYHGLGRGLRLASIGGPHDGETIFESRALVGEPGGGALAAPYDLSGATGLELTCSFDNPRAETVRWGIGDQEMCVVLAFTDSDVLWGGGAQDEDANQVLGKDAAGVWDNRAPCELYYFLPRD